MSKVLPGSEFQMSSFVQTKMQDQGLSGYSSAPPTVSVSYGGFTRLQKIATFQKLHITNGRSCEPTMTSLIPVLVRHFSYTPDASFSEEFLLHS